MIIESSGIRQRRKGVQKVVEELDIFEKFVDNIKDEKKSSSGLIALICFFTIFCLVVGELLHYISGKKEYNYRFDVDTALFDLPDLDIDMVIATPCNNLAVMSTMDENMGLFAPLHQSIKKDPTRFEFTEEEQMYWTILRHAHSAINNGGLRGLEELQYVDSDVQDNLEKLANRKQSDEAAAISEQRKTQEEKGDVGHGNYIFLIGNGIGFFQVVASNGDDEGTACRVHGKFPVRKGKEEKITISIGGSSLGLGFFQEIAHLEGMKQSGNISHRIEKFNFGPRVRGLVTPLAGAEQISQNGQDIYRYFIKVVPTKIYHGIFGRFTMTYQYSVTFLKKKLNDGQHSHGGILFEYEFCANIIEVRETARSIVTLFLRLCAVIGGVFATSRIFNDIIQLVLNLITRRKASPLRSVDVERSALLNSSSSVN